MGLPTTYCDRQWSYLIMFSYSLSLPLLSFHLLYITLASTLAGLDVFGSFSRLTWGEEGLRGRYILGVCMGTGVFRSTIYRPKLLTTDRRMVLTFCVGFHLSQGSSPDWGSSTGGCRMDTHRSPFWPGWVRIDGMMVTWYGC